MKYFVLLCISGSGIFSFNYQTYIILLDFINLFVESFIQINCTFEKNFISLVEVLKLILLLKVLDGLRSFILMEAESKY
jgi:hypothetical protein